MAGWFTRNRLDLGGVSTLDAITHAIDALALIDIPAPGDNETEISIPELRAPAT